MLVDTPFVFDGRLRELLQTMAAEGIGNAMKGFAGMVGQPIQVSQPQVRLVPVTDIPGLLGGPEKEAVGIYLRAYGEMAGQIVLVLAYTKALELVDLILGNPRGTVQSLGSLERSALAELGNLTGTFFLNAVAATTGFGSRPTSPAVMVDMVGAILDVVVATYGGVGKHVLLLQVAFLSAEREVQADFWVIPDPAALEGFAKRGRSHDQ